MENNSISHQINDRVGVSSGRASSKVGFAILGFLFLGAAIGFLQRLSQTFADDVYQSSFLENWLVWIAILFFASGWFITDWASTALHKKQLRLARFLLVGIILIGSILIAVYFRFFSNNAIFERFSLAAQFLIYGGFFLRYSLFSLEDFVLAQKAFWGMKM